MLQLLLTKCLLLSTSELTEWSQDAEIFYVAQEGTYVYTCMFVNLRTYKCDDRGGLGSMRTVPNLFCSY
jgi:hypothetical protein